MRRGETREIRRDGSAGDEMRQTVDETLPSTLESRLGESFRQVSERLEQVYKGLGELQALATGVGERRRVLANVKTRGSGGEVQLATLLEKVSRAAAMLSSARRCMPSNDVRMSVISTSALAFCAADICSISGLDMARSFSC